MSESISFISYITNKYREKIVNKINEFIRCRLEISICGENIKLSYRDKFDFSLEPKYFYTEDLINPFDNFKIAYFIKVKLNSKDEIPYGFDFTEGFKWITLNCKCSFKDTYFDDYEILSVDDYEKGSYKGSWYADTLVPLIDHTKYTLASEILLNSYYPEHNEELKPVNPYKIAKRLGLTVVEAIFDDESNCMGRIYFTQDSGTFFDMNTGEQLELIIPAKTVIIDKIAIVERKNSIHNAVTHECIHWSIHRYAMALRRIFNNNNIEHFICNEIYDTKIDNAISIMEAQARGIAPKVLLPKLAVDKKTKELFDEYRNLRLQLLRWFSKEEDIEIDDDPIFSIDDVIEGLKDHFGVSRFSAKIRLTELGMYEAKGAATYVDDHYVQKHKSSFDCLEDFERFAISKDNFETLLRYDPEFRSFYIDRKLTFCENFVVINDEKYIMTKNSVRKLTPYALTHMEECAVIFTADIVDIQHSYERQQLAYKFLNSDKDSKSNYSLKFNPSRQLYLTDSAYAYSMEQHHLNLLKTKSFGVAFYNISQDYMDMNEIKNSTIAIDLGCDRKTITNYRNGSIKSVEGLISICLYLKMSSYIIRKIIDHCPYRLLVDNDTNHNFYEFVIAKYAGEEYSVIQQVFKDNGYPMIQVFN